MTEQNQATILPLIWDQDPDLSNHISYFTIDDSHNSEHKALTVINTETGHDKCVIKKAYLGASQIWIVESQRGSDAVALRNVYTNKYLTVVKTQEELDTLDSKYCFNSLETKSWTGQDTQLWNIKSNGAIFSQAYSNFRINVQWSGTTSEGQSVGLWRDKRPDVTGDKGDPISKADYWFRHPIQHTRLITDILFSDGGNNDLYEGRHSDAIRIEFKVSHMDIDSTTNAVTLYYTIKGYWWSGRRPSPFQRQVTYEWFIHDKRMNKSITVPPNVEHGEEFYSSSDKITIPIYRPAYYIEAKVQYANSISHPDYSSYDRGYFLSPNKHIIPTITDFQLSPGFTDIRCSFNQQTPCSKIEYRINDNQEWQNFLSLTPSVNEVGNKKGTIHLLKQDTLYNIQMRFTSLDGGIFISDTLPCTTYKTFCNLSLVEKNNSNITLSFIETLHKGDYQIQNFIIEQVDFEGQTIPGTKQIIGARQYYENNSCIKIENLSTNTEYYFQGNFQLNNSSLSPKTPILTIDLVDDQVVLYIYHNHKWQRIE